MNNQMLRSAGRHFAARRSIWTPPEKPAKTIDTLFDQVSEDMEKDE